jgi:hypothetical protein
MPPTESTNDLQRELSEALDELQSALHRASDATGAIKGLLPRLAAAGALFDEIETLIRAGRERIGVGGDPAATAQYVRPTLVVPTPPAARPAPVLQPSSTFATPATPEEAPAPLPGAQEPGVASFRLEFDSQNGPLDLRTVDDAVGEHPAVRDVALLDYDGRRATLKVWIVETASPAEVQEALQARAEQLFGPANEVTIVALEDAA